MAKFIDQKGQAINPADATPKQFKKMLDEVSPEVDLDPSKAITEEGKSLPAAIEEKGLVASENKTRQHLRDAERMMSFSVAIGYMREFVMAGALYNVKHGKLHLAAGQTYAQYLESQGIAERTARRYVRTAEMMKSMMIERGVANPDDQNFLFNQKNIGQGFAHFQSTGNNNVTVHGLAQASRDLNTFKLYLEGSQNVAENHVIGLLQPAAEVEAEAEEKTARKDKIRAEQTAERRTTMQAIAARKGYKWNGKTFVKEDGSPLTDEEWSVFATQADLFLLWIEIQRDLASAMHDVMKKISDYGSLYIAYRDRAEPSDTKDVNERFRVAKTQIKTIGNMISAIHEGTIEEVEEIYKAGPSHH